MNVRPFFLWAQLAGMLFCQPAVAQSWDLNTDNIDRAIRDAATELKTDAMRPAFHLTPPAGCMGDPNGGIFHNGAYHIFYGLQPFAFHPGGWYWAHFKSTDLLHWDLMPNRLTPPSELKLNAIGSGSTIVTDSGKRLAFYSQSENGPMLFWRAEFQNDQLSEWKHPGKNPVLSLNHPGLPPYDDFWRDPFVFTEKGRTFLIACADLFEEDYVPVPIFEAKDDDLTEWDFQGHLFTVPKHRYRNLEVPELRPLGNRWIFLASTDAPVDRVNYFVGDFEMETLKFIPEVSGPIDYSGHYYAQETIVDDRGDLYLMAWIPGWDRDWLPGYMNQPLKNRNPRWNGCFALPRKMTFQDGQLFQQPVESLQQLRGNKFVMETKNLPVDGPGVACFPVEGFTSNQAEIQITFDLSKASFCGVNLLCDRTGRGGCPIFWSGNVLHVDGVIVPMPDWKSGDLLELRIFIDKKFVEVFADGGKYCITRQVSEENVKGSHLALTTLGGTAILKSFQAWQLQSIRQ